jgi:Omptin family
VAGTEIEFGARYWFSRGKFQWDNDRPDGVIESRLTYDGITGHSGELIGRVDTPSNIFVKGNAGVGRLTTGKMNDEDWGLPFGAFISYSNTVSHEDNGRLNYVTADLGYDLLRGPGYKVGAFVGYNHFHEFMQSFGCVQIANPAFPCLAPGDNQIVGDQGANWNSLRIGLSGDKMLSDRLKVSGEVAYLPYVKMSGRDDHILRQTLGGPQTFFDDSGTGQGVQLEAMLSYGLTSQLSLGVGARYWAMWTTDASFTCTGCGGAGVTSAAAPARFSTERYGLLLQGSYQFYGQRDLEPLK